MTYKSYKSYTTYIRTFNFTSPSWESLPIGFLERKPEELSTGEELQYNGIKMAYFLENKNKELGKMVFRGTLSATTGTFVFVFAVCLLYYLNLNLNLGFTMLTDFFA